MKWLFQGPGTQQVFQLLDAKPVLPYSTLQLPASGSPLPCSSRVNTWRWPFALRMCWVEQQVRVQLHFWWQKAVETMGTPQCSVGLDGSKRMCGDYMQLWILLVMLQSADAFFNWLVACISRIGSARCIYWSEREWQGPLERNPAVAFPRNQGSLTPRGLVVWIPGVPRTNRQVSLHLKSIKTSESFLTCCLKFRIQFPG